MAAAGQTMEVDSNKRIRDENDEDLPGKKKPKPNFEVPSLFPVTVIGSFPRPSFIEIPSWFDGICTADYVTNCYDKFIAEHSQDEIEDALNRGIASIIDDQIQCGIHILTDGELPRENYVHYHCRHLNGIDFENLTTRSLRNGNYTQDCPTVVSKVTSKGPFLLKDWRRAQKVTDHPIKVTIPGPLTIIGTVANQFYENEDELAWDLAVAINEEILNLVSNGVKYIQIDDPLLARQIEKAKKFALRCHKRCWDDVPSDVHKSCHICCGYTNILDDSEYKKAENHAYVQLAENGLDDLGLDSLSVEDAHTRIPIEFFHLMKKTSIVLGCVRVCVTNLYTKDEIVSRVKQIVDEGNVAPQRLTLAPDCGLAMLTRDAAIEKLNVLKQARDELHLHYCQS